MKTRVQFWLLALVLFVGGNLVVSAPAIAAEGESDPTYDHLRCWTIEVDEHRFSQQIVVETQFDDGRQCKIELPAKRFCVEAQKRYHGYDGNDDRWNEAGHWLCYRIVSCKGHPGWDFVDVHDQFSEKFLGHDDHGDPEPWHVKRVKNDYFCTPAVKEHPHQPHD